MTIRRKPRDILETRNDDREFGGSHNLQYDGDHYYVMEKTSCDISGSNWRQAHKGPAKDEAIKCLNTLASRYRKS